MWYVNIINDMTDEEKEKRFILTMWYVNLANSSIASSISS